MAACSCRKSMDLLYLIYIYTYLYIYICVHIYMWHPSLPGLTQHFLISSPSGCVMVGKLLSFSEPQFLYIETDNSRRITDANSSYWICNHIISVILAYKYASLFPPQDKHSGLKPDALFRPLFPPAVVKILLKMLHS